MRSGEESDEKRTFTYAERKEISEKDGAVCGGALRFR